MYPHIRQPRHFLIQTPPQRAREVAAALRRNLGEAGLEVRETTEVLTELAGVENAYISAFVALGGFGLLLGTMGLAAALLRSAVERRRELAILRAIGFPARTVAAVLALEHAAPLTLGAIAGAACAVLACAPRLMAGHQPLAWMPSAALIAAIAAGGCALCAWASAATLRGRSMEALRGE